jgi:hypothetical protein
MTLAEFVTKHVNHNAIIRIWEKVQGGHKQIGDTMMAHKVSESLLANRNFKYVTDIVVTHEAHPEAINLVIENE